MISASVLPKLFRVMACSSSTARLAGSRLPDQLGSTPRATRWGGVPQPLVAQVAESNAFTDNAGNLCCRGMKACQVQSAGTPYLLLRLRRS